ncbi:hypothetical protein M378DRAFT_67051 [Amanita muscaria Koide BX008]|uniref:Uncharacterized protein n=1 Tax=Amanita muscaria (strain Koide BX008) TaxID=946122 RepID=A0A0C2XNC7_AMAMK|nr:hypothetical protein M378DRAFT_67051 [Amanita muscaria Koide BX008]
MFCRSRWRRKEIPWEVVGAHEVDPVRMFDEDEADLDIRAIGNRVIRRTYFFNIREQNGGNIVQSAVIFARQLLIKEIQTRGFNVLLYERRVFLLYRRGNQHRVEVRYRGMREYP